MARTPERPDQPPTTVLRPWATSPKWRAAFKAHRAFLDSFQRKVDPEGVMDPRERAIRAERALRAHMLRLSLRSLEVRQARAQRLAEQCSTPDRPPARTRRDRGRTRDGRGRGR